MLRLSLCLALAFAAASPAAVTVRKAVFSDRQLFWPDLEGKGRPAPAAAKPAPRSRAAPAQAGANAVRLAVLPVALRAYSETLPCDSCHRLSANGLEFFLENYLRARMEARFPGRQVELVAPSDPLVEKRVDLMGYLDSLRLPWEKWLPDSGEAVVYRPRDRFTDAAARSRLDRLGGLLGASHLLLPARMHAKVRPAASNLHAGGLDWGFSLVLWNVAAGGPEWALEYRESEPAMDLDESLESRLDKALGAAWAGLPAELLTQWAAEPR
jgi:hypothetical protein